MMKNIIALLALYFYIAGFAMLGNYHSYLPYTLLCVGEMIVTYVTDYIGLKLLFNISIFNADRDLHVSKKPLLKQFCFGAFFIKILLPLASYLMFYFTNESFYAMFFCLGFSLSFCQSFDLFISINFIEIPRNLRAYARMV